MLYWSNTILNLSTILIRLLYTINFRRKLLYILNILIKILFYLLIHLWYKNILFFFTNFNLHRWTDVQSKLHRLHYSTIHRTVCQSLSLAMYYWQYTRYQYVCKFQYRNRFPIIWDWNIRPTGLHLKRRKFTEKPTDIRCRNKRSCYLKLNFQSKKKHVFGFYFGSHFKLGNKTTPSLRESKR